MKKNSGSSKAFHMIAFFLLIIGGLNWLMVGAFQWDIGMLFGGMDAMVSRFVYVLVGAAALYELFTHKCSCTYCGMKKK